MSAAAHLFGRGSLIVASILLARQLPTEAFAAYSYFQLTVSMLAAYAAMGMGVTASRFFAETGYVKDAQMSPIGTLWLLSIVVAAVISLLILALPPAWLGGGLDIPRWAMALGIFCMATGVVPAGAIIGLERYREALISAVTSAVVLIIGMYVVNSAVGAMSVFIAAAFIQSIGNSAVVFRHVSWKTLTRHSGLGKKQVHQIIKFAGPMLAVTLLAASGSWLVGRIILNSPSGEHGFSLYVIGLQWYALALFLPGMISRVLLPRMVRTQLKESESGSPKIVRIGSILSIAITAATAIVGALLAPSLVGIYGPDYQAQPSVLTLFLIAAIPAAPANTIGNAIVASNGQKTWLILTITWFAVLLCTMALLKPFGASGGAIAHGASSLLLSILTYIWAKRRGLI